MTGVKTAEASEPVQSIDTPPVAPGLHGFRLKIATWGLSVGVVVVLLGMWQISSSQGWIDPFFVSSPARVAERTWTLFADGTIWPHIWVTFREAIFGYIPGCLAGVMIGFILAQSRILASALMPLLNLANTLPRVALAPLFILWFGIGMNSKIAIVFSVVIVILVFNTYSGTQTVDRDVITNARMLGATRLQVLLKITLPWTMPWIFTGLSIALAWSLGGAVIGEYLAANEGVGYLIFFYSGTLDQTGMLAGCVVLLMMSAVMFAVLTAAERRVLRWRP